MVPCALEMTGRVSGVFLCRVFVCKSLFLGFDVGLAGSGGVEHLRVSDLGGPVTAFRPLLPCSRLAPSWPCVGSLWRQPGPQPFMLGLSAASLSCPGPFQLRHQHRHQHQELKSLAHLPGSRLSVLDSLWHAPHRATPFFTWKGLVALCHCDWGAGALLDSCCTL